MRCKLYTREMGPEELLRQETRKKIYEYLKEHPMSRKADIARAVGFEHPASISTHMWLLEKAEVIEKADGFKYKINERKEPCSSEKKHCYNSL